MIGGYAFDADTAARFHRFLLVLAVLATSFSAFLTSAKFSAGDRLLVCWLLVGAGYFLAAVRHGVRLASYLDSSVALPPAVNSTLAILQNVAIAIALLLFVLAWRATGLTAPLSTSAQTVSILTGIAVAVLVGGYPLMKALTTANADPILLVSTLGDIVGLSLIVPLALPALAMRGGLLMHTWIYLAASEVAWLLYDLWWSIQPQSTAILEAFRLAAVLLAFIATMAQRRAMRA
ncbi:MAG TPA: hypothetical protein VGQ36_11555 [Thermoanaerobaculia bacterium]|nr:hypothetical protein [Thermoanaerobaculia bacterium]